MTEFHGSSAVTPGGAPVAVDTSFFPTIGAVNPSLTAIANALRVGDHLLDRLG